MKAGNLEEVPGHPVKRESAQDDAEPLTRAMIDDVLKAAGVDPVTNENREICENLISDWRLQAALDLEKVRYPR